MLRRPSLKTLHGLRRQILGWGGALAAIVLLTASALAQTYPPGPARELLAQQITGSLAAAQVFYGRPVDLRQMGGLLEWRSLSIYPVMLGLFLIIAGTGISRGAEERGELDVVLAGYGRRGRLFAELVLALAAALLVVDVAIWLALAVSGAVAGEPALNPVHATLAVLNVSLGAAMFGALALLLAQLTASRRTAALGAGAALIAAHIWSNLGVTIPALAGTRWLSPLFLVSRSTPLATGHTSVPAMAGMLLLVVVLAVGAGRLFTRRDIGAVSRLPVAMFGGRAAGSLKPGSSRLLGGVMGRAVRANAGTALAWGAGMAVMVLLFTTLTPSFIHTFDEQQQAQDFINRLGRGTVGSATGFLALSLFSFLPLLVAISATMFTASLPAEEQSGRLEVELAAPASRRAYLVRRALAVLLLLALLPAAMTVLLLAAARLLGLDLRWGRAAAAMLLMIPLGWAVAAAGFAVAGFRPGWVTPLVSLLVGASFFLDLLGPLLGLPDITRSLSVFHLYGQPLLAGVDVGNALLLFAATAVLLVVAVLGFERRDVVK